MNNRLDHKLTGIPHRNATKQTTVSEKASQTNTVCEKLLAKHLCKHVLSIKDKVVKQNIQWYRGMASS